MRLKTCFALLITFMQIRNFYFFCKIIAFKLVFVKVKWLYALAMHSVFKYKEYSNHAESSYLVFLSHNWNKTSKLITTLFSILDSKACSNTNIAFT